MPKSGVIFSIRLEGDTTANAAFAKMAESLNQTTINIDKMAGRMNQALQKMGEHGDQIDRIEKSSWKAGAGLGSMATSLLAVAGTYIGVNKILSLFTSMDEAAASLVTRLEGPITKQINLLNVQGKTLSRLAGIPETDLNKGTGLGKSLNVANITTPYGYFEQSGDIYQVFQAMTKDKQKSDAATKVVAQMMRLGSSQQSATQMIAMSQTSGLNLNAQGFGNVMQMAGNISSLSNEEISSQMPFAASQFTDPFMAPTLLASIPNATRNIPPMSTGLYLRQAGANMKDPRMTKFMEAKGYYNWNQMADLDRFEALDYQMKAAGMADTIADRQNFLRGQGLTDDVTMTTLSGEIRSDQAIAASTQAAGSGEARRMHDQLVAAYNQGVQGKDLLQEQINFNRQQNPLWANQMDLDVAKAEADKRLYFSTVNGGFGAVQEQEKASRSAGQRLRDELGPQLAKTLGLVDDSGKATTSGNLWYGMSRTQQEQMQNIVAPEYGAPVGPGGNNPNIPPSQVAGARVGVTAHVVRDYYTNYVGRPFSEGLETLCDAGKQGKDMMEELYQDIRWAGQYEFKNGARVTPDYAALPPDPQRDLINAMEGVTSVGHQIIKAMDSGATTRQIPMPPLNQYDPNTQADTR